MKKETGTREEGGGLRGMHLRGCIDGVLSWRWHPVSRLSDAALLSLVFVCLGCVSTVPVFNPETASDADALKQFQSTAAGFEYVDFGSVAVPAANHRHPSGERLREYAASHGHKKRRSRAPTGAKRGLFLVPPFGGVRLQALINGRQPVSVKDFCCKTSSGGQWIPAWIPNLDNWVHVATSFCNIENLQLPPPHGVSIRYEDSFDACAYIDQERKVPVFGIWTDALIQAGWEVGQTLFALPFDFRYGPQTYRKPGREFDRLQRAIEGAVAASGGPVVLAGMSMGAPMAALFLGQHVSEEWKVAHVHSFLSLSGVYGGAVSPLRGLLTGRWADLVPSFVQTETLQTVRSFESVPWLMPSGNSEVFARDRVWVSAGGQQYASRDIGRLLRSAGANQSALMWEQSGAYRGNAFIPNVTTYCLYGRGVPTLASMYWTGEAVGDPDHMTFEPGDGTVLHDSLAVCSGWGKLQAAPVHTMTWPNLTHSGILAFEPAFKVLLHVLGLP